MKLEECTYSVLIVSANESFGLSLSSLLIPSRFQPQLTVKSTGSALRAFSERVYDLVIINARFPDEPMLTLAQDLARSSSTSVLLLVPSEFLQETLSRVRSYGVFVLDKPASRHMVETALSWLISSCERLRYTEKRALSLEERMQEIRLINRAKWALIDRYGWTEPQAHHYLEKEAMDRGLPKREIAEKVLHDS